MPVLTITSGPAPFSWSKNPVEFKLLYTGQITGDLVLQYSVLMNDSSNVSGYSSVFEGTTRFNNGGFTSVDIARILDANLDYFIASPWDKEVSPDQCLCFTNQCRKYQVLFQVVYTSSVGGIPVLATSNQMYVAKGGVQIEQWERDAVYNFFWSGTQRFLNYHNNDVFFGSQGFLFPAFIPNNTLPLTLDVTYYYNGGGSATQELTLGVCTKGLYYVVPVVIYDQPDTFKITYNLRHAGTVISDTITCYLDQRRFNFTKFFAYINSLGGTEWLALPFNQVAAANVNSSVFSRFNNAPPAKYNMVIDTQNFQNNFTEQLLETMDSGELGYKNLDHLRQLVLSPAAFELMTEGHIESRLKYVPVTVTANAQGSLSSPGNTPASQQPLMDNAARAPIPLRPTSPTAQAPMRA